MSSIDSPAAPEQAPPTEAEQQQAALREAYETTEGIRRLLRMVGVKSLKGNLQAEDEAVRRDIEKGQELYGIKPVASTAGKADEMEVMAARDVIVNHYESAAAAERAKEPTTMPATATAPSKLATAGKAALIAAALGGGPLTAIAMNYFADKAVPAIGPAIERAPDVDWQSGFVPLNEGQP